jgi:hypothetical protein
MQDVLGTPVHAFIIITVIIIGFAAWMTGQAVATTWRPYWHLPLYCCLLGVSARFLNFALADGDLLSPTGYVIDTTVLTVIASFAYRLCRAQKMVSQYPWLYDRVGLFGWRERR